jgi:hypothetical protein
MKGVDELDIRASAVPGHETRNTRVTVLPYLHLFKRMIKAKVSNLHHDLCVNLNMCSS